MIAVVAVLAMALVVALVALVVVTRSRTAAAARDRRAISQRDDQVKQAEEDRTAATAAGLDAQQRADGALRRAEEASSRADAAELRIVDAEAAVASRPSPTEVLRITQGRLDALWQLTTLAAASERRRFEKLSTAGAVESGPDDLAEVLSVEVGRFREEVGTPGALRVSLDPAPSPAVAAVMARAVQLLLETLARHCQGYDVTLQRRPDQLEAVVVCDGFDGPDTVTDEISALSMALVPAGGGVEVDRDVEDRLRARVSLAAQVPD